MALPTGLSNFFAIPKKRKNRLNIAETALLAPRQNANRTPDTLPDGGEIPVCHAPKWPLQGAKQPETSGISTRRTSWQTPNAASDKYSVSQIRDLRGVEWKSRASRFCGLNWMVTGRRYLHLKV
ncbi:MAG TPA: hypothetical protein VF627_09685 [Abditibacterium sp.]|jgi:hypothetical protein